MATSLILTLSLNYLSPLGHLKEFRHSLRKREREREREGERVGGEANWIS